MIEQLGVIMPWPSPKLPNNWMLCDGSKLKISEYERLYKAIGTTYGGDGKFDFALPNLNDRILIGTGTGYDEQLGQSGGANAITLEPKHLPAHNHKLRANVMGGNSSEPGGRYLASSKSGDRDYSTISPTVVALSENALAKVGDSIPFNVEQPYLIMYYIICVKT